MKKFLSSIALVGTSLLIGVNVSAMVQSVHEEETNWKLTYPVVSIDNYNAQESINADLQQYIDSLRSDFDQGKYYSCGGSYKVHYEDNEILSISLYLSRYPFGANGNHTRTVDIVYDKNTGERIPLYNYVRVTAEDLDYYKYGHTYSQVGERIKPDSLWKEKIKTVPDNYFLVGGGTVCIVFRPYDLAAGYRGATYIQLEPEYVNYLNRKNQW